jgi:hypothetical protein
MVRRGLFPPAETEKCLQVRFERAAQKCLEMMANLALAGHI